MNKLVLSAMLCVAVVTACTKQEPAVEAAKPQAEAGAKLDAVLAAQAPEVKARYAHRHPKETLEFFGIVPGMTVVDTLPDQVWYTGILLKYLGPSGKVIGADYAPDMWAQFGDYAPKPEEKVDWPAKFVTQAQAWRGEGDAQLAAFQYGAIPDALAGTADAVLLIRALHHFTRMEGKGQYLTKALADINKVLKPGGVVGVVQHRAPESSDDAWATGENGYVKQSAVVAAFEAAGFKLEGVSEINANPKDQPTDKDFVWRLPPTLATSQGNAELKAQMEAIGESDRMTLKFRKPK